MNLPAPEKVARDSLRVSKELLACVRGLAEKDYAELLNQAKAMADTMNEQHGRGEMPVLHVEGAAFHKKCQELGIPSSLVDDLENLLILAVS